MAIPNLHPVANTNQTPCLDLVPASQLVVDPICSWRSEGNPNLEFKVTSDGENIRYSVYDHHPNIRHYWPSSPSSSAVFTSVFTRCVWKSNGEVIESRLFRNRFAAVLVSFTAEKKIIGVKEWMDAYMEKFLIGNNPIVSAINDDNSLEFEEETRETPRSRPYDPEAEEGITRWRKAPQAEQAGITEETVKVWPGLRDWEKGKMLEVPSRLASCASSSLSDDENVDTVIEKIQDYALGLEIVENKEMITIYRQSPLSYFMPGYLLSKITASEVERWIGEQFYRKEGENKQRFEYTNFVSAKRTVFSFANGMRGENRIKSDSALDAWHVEMKRVAAWSLQFPVGISNFFAGIFLARAQDPTMVDKQAMERLVQGVPLFDAERNKIADDFAAELAACSTINFYIACDRSISQFEVNGRARVLYVYGTSEDRQPKYAVEDICESIRTMAEVEGRKIPVEEKISTVRKIGQVCLPLLEGIKSVSHFFVRGIGMIWQLFWNRLKPKSN